MPIEIQCPACQRSLTIKEPKPGKYKPKCSKCGESFSVAIESSSDVDRPFLAKVSKIVSKPSHLEPESQPKPLSADSRPPNPPSPMAKLASDLEATSISQSTSGQSTSGQSTSGQSLSSRSESMISRPEISGLEATIESDASSHSQPTRSTQLENTLVQTRDGDFVESTQTPSETLAATRPPQHVPAASTPKSAASPSASGAKASGSSLLLSITKLGGYRLVKELGAGGMGSVFLARQMSLDRPCALKTIQAQWAKNPRVIARFIREAYAAAQLTHHNVVQIYDLGQDTGINFFSMELVGGGSLSDQLREQGKLAPEVAATLILQAARGLKFAHDHGMVHRDIKPANLMLTADGLVKVADLGLVKTLPKDDAESADESDTQSLALASARSQVTMMGASMGTPAYMSPEQADDAASVDKRADIYSLGCTFYALLTGKPPFEGNSLLEVITKHRQQKIIRPERVIAGVPSELGDIIEKMTEKKPEDRYQDLSDVIRDLESFSAKRQSASQRESAGPSVGAGGTSPSDGGGPDEDSPSDHGKPMEIRLTPEQAARLQHSIRQFQSSPLARIRGLLPPIWYGLCGSLAILSLLFALWSGVSMIGQGAMSLVNQASEAFGQSDPSGAVATDSKPTISYFSNMVGYFKSSLLYVVALILAPVWAVAVAGTEQRSPLAQRWREAVAHFGIGTWIYWSFALLIALMAIYFLGLLVTMIIAVLISAAAGTGYYFGIERPLWKARQPSLESARSTLKSLRLHGADEGSLRRTVADHAGKNWEEFFESLFDYDAMRSMRDQLGTSKKGLKIFRPTRDRLVDRWNVRLQELRNEKDEKVLVSAERADLVASGMSADEARKQASLKAALMIDAAGETRMTMHELAAGKLTEAAAEAKRQKIKQMLAEARSGKLSKREVRDRSLDRILGQVLGSKFRFACAAVFFLGTGLWIQANQKEVANYWQKAKSSAAAAVESVKDSQLKSSDLASAQDAINQAANQAANQVKQSLAPGASVVWNPALGGLVTQKNVLFVGLAGLLMLFGTFLGGWRISLLLVPIAGLLLFIPRLW